MSRPSIEDVPESARKQLEPIVAGLRRLKEVIELNELNPSDDPAFLETQLAEVGRLVRELKAAIPSSSPE